MFLFNSDGVLALPLERQEDLVFRDGRAQHVGELADVALGLVRAP